MPPVTYKVQFLSSEAFLADRYANFNTLFFTRHEDTFLLVTNLENIVDIQTLAQRTARTTGFEWDKKIIRGWQHNAELEENQEENAQREADSLSSWYE